jgi:hypothetical protein
MTTSTVKINCLDRDLAIYRSMGAPVNMTYESISGCEQEAIDLIDSGWTYFEFGVTLSTTISVIRWIDTEKPARIKNLVEMWKKSEGMRSWFMSEFRPLLVYCGEGDLAFYIKSKSLFKDEGFQKAISYMSESTIDSPEFFGDDELAEILSSADQIERKCADRFGIW